MRDEIIRAIRRNLLDIVPELAEVELDLYKPLSEQGANSVDRAEALAQTLFELNLDVPLSTFAGVKTIAGWADIIVAQRASGTTS